MTETIIPPATDAYLDLMKRCLTHHADDEIFLPASAPEAPGPRPSPVRRGVVRRDHGSEDEIVPVDRTCVQWRKTRG